MSAERAGASGDAGFERRAPSKASERAAPAPLLREETAGDSAVPRLELADWAARYGVVAGITTRGRGFSLGLWSEENVGQVMTRWRAVRAAFRPRFPGLVLAHQVHGSAVAWHPQAAEGWLILDAIDAHVTATRGLLLSITVADCIPVYLTVAAKPLVALVHAGWRGTAAGILERAVAVMQERGCVRASDIVMHCGVGICGACYEVGSEVLTQFTGRPEAGPGQLDLRGVLIAQARSLGLEGISISPWCSAHDRERFFSHRASGGRDGRMIAYAGVPLA